MARAASGISIQSLLRELPSPLLRSRLAAPRAVPASFDHLYSSPGRHTGVVLRTPGDEGRRERPSGSFSYARLHSSFSAGPLPPSSTSSSWAVKSSETAALQQPGSSERPTDAADGGANDVAGEESAGSEAASTVTDDQVVPALRSLRLASGACVLPHPDKVHKGGEDAFFIAQEPFAIGVADGVGGWAELGVDAGAYARELMEKVRGALVAGKEGGARSGATAPADAETESTAESGVQPAVGAQGSESGRVRAPYFEDVSSDDSSSEASGSAVTSSSGSRRPAEHPLQSLLEAHATTTSQGSSTACIVMLSDRSLVAANVGDSGFLIVRSGRAIFKSPPQQHDFNFPYQLGSEGGDSPHLAQVFDLPVLPGDVVVLGTDGLFDNVFDPEVAALVSASLQAGLDPQATAQRIASVAQMRAKDRMYRSPFARAAEAAGYFYVGGKLDDITVVVSYVVSE